MSIAVGSIVTWRSGKSRSNKVIPIGIAQCKVLEVGESSDGQAAAKIKLPAIFQGEEVGALVADLELT